MDAHIQDTIQKFKNLRVLVIGDFILDQYTDSDCNRLAPEAGVPVLQVTNQTVCMGGAGNVVLNLCNLGASVSYVTILGQDEAAKTAIRLLHESGVKELDVHFTDQSPTLQKNRLRTEGRYLYRVDIGEGTVASPAVIDAYIQNIKKAYRAADAIFVADYDKGNINEQVLETLKNLQEEQDKVIAVDCKNYERYKALHPTIIKPNYNEALSLLKAAPAANRVEQAVGWSGKFWDLTNSEISVLSLDKDGVVVSNKGQLLFHYDVPEIDVVNVSGAGDTLLASFLLAYLAGASTYDCAHIACTAAGLAIKKSVTAHCTFGELQLGLINLKDKVVDSLPDIGCLANALRDHKKIVFTNGCFDIFHSGHAKYLAQAKELGDILVVGVNNDQSVRRIKGNGRPVNRLNDRLEVLKQLSCVDYIVPFGEENDDTPIKLIETICPHVFVKGEDYKNGTLPEVDMLNELGVQVEFMPYLPHQSTTKIIDRVQKKDFVSLKKTS